MGGRACIRGDAHHGSLVVNLVGTACRGDEVVRDYPTLNRRTSGGLVYASALASGRGPPVHQARGVKFLADMAVSMTTADLLRKREKR